MKQLLIALIVVGVLGLIVYGASALTGKKDVMMTKPPIQAEEANTEDAMVKEAAMSEKSTGRYVPYSQEAFTAAASTRRVLFFYANWCPTCKPADASFTEKNSSIPENVTLLRVNYNDNETDAAEKELARTYAVTYQHTFVEVDESGAEVTRWSGGGIKELLAHL